MAHSPGSPRDASVYRKNPTKINKSTSTCIVIQYHPICLLRQWNFYLRPRIITFGKAPIRIKSFNGTETVM